MNFLSHYYFDRDTTDCYYTLGTVLPDLLKNADKTIVLHPEDLVHNNAAVNSIINGWNKHLLVDKYFHSSEFFKTHSHQLKKELLPALKGSPVKPFFLGHIGIELILDNLLLTTHKIKVGDFYEHLNTCSERIIYDFLVFAGMEQPLLFFKFFDDFKKSRYLRSYSEIEQVTYALKRICMRVWANPFSLENEAGITAVVLNYRTAIFDNFMQIYTEIEEKLSF
ncbi:hypothetical protein [Mucilaginibacter segetis]|uniref:DUF479 domain-containing protein n=1 Tax=Mucilaginibacter segetis TaxID=2793071 RepID=A0A934UNP6_9SPHI|nr:hypothetical protein [Mucilaginibacter segetis]MBK0381023.1 hypothetical protein [Mucilaginibacter segetis]